MIIERELYQTIKPYLSAPEIIVITGMRRVGKTTLLYHIMNSIKSNNKIYLDLENPANQKIFEENDYDKILDSFRFLNLNPKKRGYVFLDEIQLVKNAASVVKYLYDHYKIKFILSGSASFYLKNVFSESLAGRKYIFELFPFSFFEFLKAKSVAIQLPANEKTITEAIFQKINRYYEEYLRYGGFPGVVTKELPSNKNKTLEDIFSSYFQLEVRQIGDFRKIDAMRDLIFLLMERMGSKLDVSKLSKELGITRQTVNNFISFLENTYFIKLIRPYSRNRDTEIRSAPKFYLCDTGIANRFARLPEGAVFENAIFNSLRLRGEINYFQKKSGVEIDFILNKKTAYEIKTKADKNDVRKLEKIAKELKLKDYKVISKKFSAVDKVSYGFLV